MWNRLRKVFGQRQCYALHIDAFSYIHKFIVCTAGTKSNHVYSDDSSPPLASIKPMRRPKPPLGVIVKKRPPIDGAIVDDASGDDHTNDRTVYSETGKDARNLPSPMKGIRPRQAAARRVLDLVEQPELKRPEVVVR